MVIFTKTNDTLMLIAAMALRQAELYSTFVLLKMSLCMYQRCRAQSMQEALHFLPSSSAPHLQAYAKQLGACLLEITGHHSLQASQQLERLTTELTGLVACVALANPQRLQVLHASRMDADGISSNDSASEPNYASIVVRYTEDADAVS